MIKHLFSISQTGKLRLLNNWLNIAIAVLALYIVIAPLLPQATWIVSEHTPLGNVIDQSAEVTAAANESPGANRLFVPRLGLNEQIYEGGVEQLNNGVLRRNFTSTPPEESNTVLAGHRFGYDGTGVFYHLDKLRPGDEITVHWEGTSYVYAVQDSKVVTADAVYIEAPTDEPLLTLYTCTPLWNAVDRLVVTAALTSGVSE